MFLGIVKLFSSFSKLEDTAGYAGILLAPAEALSFGQFFFSGIKRANYAVLAHFRQFLSFFCQKMLSS